MSANPNFSVVVASHYAPNMGEWRYTAQIVMSPSYLLEPNFGYERACEHFFAESKIWFWGAGGLGRAKQLAHLLVEDFRMSEWPLASEKPFFVLISDEDRSVRETTRKGRVI